MTLELIDGARKLYEIKNGELDFVDCINVEFLKTYGIPKIVSFEGDYDLFFNEGKAYLLVGHALPLYFKAVLGKRSFILVF